MNVLLISPTFSQNVNEGAIRNELQEQGIDDKEVERRLIQRGFDLNNIDSNDPQQILELQQATEEIIAEIKSEKQNLIKKRDNVKQDTSEVKVVKQKDEIINSSQVVNNFDRPDSNKIPVVYGHQLFTSGSIRFYKKSEYINTPNNYILGPGDEVSVSIWGRSEANFSQEITKDGYVKFSRIPRLSIAGLKLEDAKEVVKSQLAKSYPLTDETFDFNVVATRNINVFITGEVLNVGSFNMSAVNTAINALAASGGPTKIGSVRNIKIIGSNGDNRNLDLYDFMNDPSKVRDLYLFEGDYIVVPIANKIVEVRGAVTRPMKYELNNDETLSDLIDLAGGLKYNARKKNVKITRYVNDEKVILNTDLTNLQNIFELKNGDLVEISEINNEIKNAIFAVGAIENEGQFELFPNMKLSNLLELLVLNKDAILEIGYLVRLNSDQKTVSWEIVNLNEILNDVNSPSNIELRAGDKLIIRGEAGFNNSNSFEIKGAVNNEGQFQLDQDKSLKVSDAIFLASGLQPSATNFGYIIRNTPGSLTPDYIPLDLDAILDNPQSDKNLNLAPGDIVQIYSKSQYANETFVSVEGAVRNPDSYKFDESLTLNDVLVLSQGITIEGSYQNIDIFRLEFKNNKKTRTLVKKVRVDENYSVIGESVQLEPFDHIIVRKAPEFEKQREIFVNGEVSYPGKYYIIGDNYKIVDLVKEAGGATDEAFLGGATLKRTLDDIGYIVIDLNSAMNKPNTTSNVVLQEGDSLFIPKLNNLVTVIGAVNKYSSFNREISNTSNINFVYEPGKSAKHYIDMSGGFVDNANKNSVTVKYPNGELKHTSRFLFFRNYPKVKPGSLITVELKSEEELRSKREREPVDWEKVLSNSVAQATTILSLILLIQNVN